MVMKKGEFMKQILMCLPEIFSGQKNLSKVINWLRKRGIHETDIYVSTKVVILLSGNFALESHLESEPLLGG